MLKLLIIVSLLVTPLLHTLGAVPGPASTNAPALSGAPLKLEVPWRMAIYDLCRVHLQHPAWGLPHCERDYLLAVSLARDEKLEIDEEVLFAAAFLHDIGAFEPYRRDDMDHTERGAQIAGEILLKAGFPEAKLPKVEEAIRGHMFYSKKPESPEAIVLHDADTLDFLGAIGTARLLSVTSHHRWAPDLKGAVDTIDKFRKELPEKLFTATAKKIARTRAEETKRFLEKLDGESFGRKSL